MYHYIEDKVFLKDMKYLCSNIINQLVQLINNDSLMEVKAHLVGSGAKNLITQNSNEPIDLDYNLMIIHSETLYLIFDYPYKYYTFKHFEV